MLQGRSRSSIGPKNAEAHFPNASFYSLWMRWNTVAMLGPMMLKHSYPAAIEMAIRFKEQRISMAP